MVCSDYRASNAHKGAKIPKEFIYELSALISHDPTGTTMSRSVFEQCLCYRYSMLGWHNLNVHEKRERVNEGDYILVASGGGFESTA